MTIPFSFPTRYIRTHRITGGNSGEFNQCSLWNPTQSNFCCASIRQAPRSSHMHACGAPSADGACKACVLQHITADSSKERLRMNWGESEVVLGKVARAGQKYCSDEAGLLVSPPSSWCWSTEALIILYFPKDALRRVPVFMDQLVEVDIYNSGSRKVKVNHFSLVTVVIVHLGPKDTSHLALPDLKSSTRVASWGRSTCQTVLQNVGFRWILLGVETLVTVE